MQHARFAEALERVRIGLYERDRLGELQLALIGLEGELVERHEIALEPGRAGQAVSVGARERAGSPHVLRGLPVVVRDEYGYWLLALEPELSLSQLRQRGRLVQEVGEDRRVHGDHRLAQRGAAELLRGDEVHYRLRALVLELRDHVILGGNPHLVARQADLAFAE